MPRIPDISLEATELQLLAKFHVTSEQYDEIRASIGPIVALTEYLLGRQAIPDVRPLNFQTLIYILKVEIDIGWIRIRYASAGYLLNLLKFK